MQQEDSPVHLSVCCSCYLSVLSCSAGRLSGVEAWAPATCRALLCSRYVHVLWYSAGRQSGVSSRSLVFKLHSCLAGTQTDVSCGCSYFVPSLPISNVQQIDSPVWVPTILYYCYVPWSVLSCQGEFQLFDFIIRTCIVMFSRKTVHAKWSRSVCRLCYAP